MFKPYWLNLSQSKSDSGLRRQRIRSDESFLGVNWNHKRTGENWLAQRSLVRLYGSFRERYHRQMGESWNTVLPARRVGRTRADSGEHSCDRQRGSDVKRM